jgi:hypothetical protein
VNTQGLKISNRQIGDLKEIGANEGFTAGESYTIHAWKLFEDRLDMVDLKIVVPLHFP